MLHSPDWNRGTLAGLRTWLEGKPRDEVYEFTNTRKCPAAQYMAGIPRQDWSRKMIDIYMGRDPHGILIGDCVSGRTYGAALARAYKALEAGHWQ